MKPEELAAYLREQHEQERQALFGNEAFVIGMLQTVALAASIALISGLVLTAALLGAVAGGFFIIWAYRRELRPNRIK